MNIIVLHTKPSSLMWLVNKRHIALMSKLVLITAIVTSVVTTSGLAQSQSPEDAAAACKEAARLIEEDDLIGALGEAQWCVDSLQQLKQQQTLTLFPETLEGFNGGELADQSAMGMTMIERVYEKNDQSVSVSLTSGIAGSGLAALAQLGLGLSMGTGAAGIGKKLRVQKRTVVNMSKPESGSEYMVQLKSGGMLMITSDDLNEEDLLSFVKAFPIAELDDALAK